MTPKNQIAIAVIVLIAAITRLIPHPMNFAPLGAMALFSAAYFGKNGKGLIVTMAAWFISDFILNNFVYAFSDSLVFFTPGALFIYGSIVLIYFMGSSVLSKINLPRMIGGSLIASVLFFLLSNFGVWFGGTMYPMNAIGLIECYAAGIPFFGNTLAGDLFYSGALFLIYERLYKAQLEQAKLRG